jgi:hypothetical protein
MRVYDQIKSLLDSASSHATTTRIHLNSPGLTIRGDMTMIDYDSGGYVLGHDGRISIEQARNYIRSVTTNDPNAITVSYDDIIGWNKHGTKISSYLSQAESLLAQVEQIISVQEVNARLTSQNATLTQELMGVNARIDEVQQQIAPLQDQVDGFSIANTINTLSPAQKAHLLQKTWHQADELSTSIVELIKEDAFDPHYVNGSNVSLLETAINSNDEVLFDMLVAKGLRFTQAAKPGKNFFAIVQDSNKDSFIKKMLDTKQNFGQPLADLVKNGETEKLEKLFTLDSSLTKATYQGHSLLKIALITQNDPALKLLVDKGDDLSRDMIHCLKQNRVEFINKLLGLKPDLLSLVSSSIEEESALGILNSNDQVLKIYDTQGNNLLYYALMGGNAPATKVFLSRNAEGLKDPEGNNLLLKILHTDGELMPKIEAFKILFAAGAHIGDIAKDLGDQVLEYPDVAEMFVEYEMKIAGGGGVCVGEPQ